MATAPQRPPRHAPFTGAAMQVEVPSYDSATYESHLANGEWSKVETDYLVDVYRECNGKWPVVADRYEFAGGPQRSMEALKARFYRISATLLQLQTPITAMTGPQYNLYETLSKFDPKQEANRKSLAEGHLMRLKNEVDEEAVLLSELQRIMKNQGTIDMEREDLRRRLDYPRANSNGYSYTSSQALTGLWQQLLATDRMKKNQRLRPTGHAAIDGLPTNTPTSARPRESNAGSSAPPQNSLPVDLSKVDMLRFGVVQDQEKLPSGVTFASDKLTKPRIAKSQIQTEKIVAILSFAGVQEIIPLATTPVIEQFDKIMNKVQALLDIRKLKEKDEHEIKVRESEIAQGQ